MADPMAEWDQLESLFVCVIAAVCLIWYLIGLGHLFLFSYLRIRIFPTLHSQRK